MRVCIPVPKKDNFSLCDNWRGVSLLNLVGKGFAKLVQELSQEVMEETFQCGFQCNSGCTNMTCQLVER